MGGRTGRDGPCDLVGRSAAEDGDAGASMSPVTAGARGRSGAPGARAVAGGRNAQPRRRENRSRAAAQLATVAASASPTREGPATVVAIAMAAVVATRLTP